MNVIQKKKRLLALAEESGALRYGDFTLSSGKKSSVYFDGRLLSLTPEGVFLLGELFLPYVIEAGASAVGGPTLGADAIVVAVAGASYQQETPIPAFIVRKEKKHHGLCSMVEGPLLKGSSVALLDDTCTTGSSLLHAIEVVEREGCSVRFIGVLLDRNEGGSVLLKERGYPFISLLHLKNTTVSITE